MIRTSLRLLGRRAKPVSLYQKLPIGFTTLLNAQKFPTYGVHQISQPHYRSYTNTFESADVRTLKSNTKYGLLHPYLRQLLRLIHPDSFRKYTQGQNAEHYTQLSLINQRSLQSINSFIATMNAHQENLRSFTNPQPIYLDFYVIIQKPGLPLESKQIKSILQYPNTAIHQWIRFPNVGDYMNQWRDVQILQLLHQANSLLQDHAFEFLPNEQELLILQEMARKTLIPLPKAFQAAQTELKQPGDHIEDENYSPEDDRILEIKRKAEKSAELLWQIPEHKSDFYTSLRIHSIDESHHPRSPEHPSNKKYGTVYSKPSKDQLKRMLKTMQIDFPVRTDPELIRAIYRYLIKNANELKIWEWYHVPIIMGTEDFCVLDKCVLGIPFHFNVASLKEFLQKYLPLIFHQGLGLRSTLKPIAEKLLLVKEQFLLIDVNVDPLVKFTELDKTLDHLLANVGAFSKFNLECLNFEFRGAKSKYGFHIPTGTIRIPLDFTLEGLRDFLAESSRKQLFSNYRIAYNSVQTLRTNLLKKCKLASLTLTSGVEKDPFLQREVLMKITDFLQATSSLELENVHVSIEIPFTNISYQSGTLHLPENFTVQELMEFIGHENQTTEIPAVEAPATQDDHPQHL